MQKTPEKLNENNQIAQEQDDNLSDKTKYKTKEEVPELDNVSDALTIKDKG